MLYKSELRERGREDFFPQPQIEESIRGVEFDFFYTGKRLGKSGNIELHVISVVRDWDQNIYLRKCWYMGQKKTWKKRIEQQIRDHLADLNTEAQLIRSLLRYFEITDDKFQPWEKYNPTYFR